MKNTLPLFALSLLTLASCSIGGNSSAASSQGASSASGSSSAASSAASSIEEGSGYTRFSTESTRLGAYPSHNIFYDESVLDTIGSPELLVIPVYTSDSGGYAASELEMIETAYNGETSETGWRSLRTFYEESSYGKLSMHATMMEPYALGQTTSAYGKAYAKMNESDFGASLNTIVQSYAKSVDLSKYDYDSDGNIDGVEFVYKNDGTEWDGETTSTEVWWAFTAVTGISANKSAPVCGAYFWSAYNMIETGYYDIDIDVHTLAHETGHLMGADDYYSYDDDTDGSPAGCCDMMDFNIGDHNAFTKSLYGWVDPYVPDGSKDEFEITLNAFESSGDCLMLVDPETWNGTQYDEYFMVQYYTPTGLYEADVDGYEEWNSRDCNYGRLYQKAGLQMFHCDARVGVQKKGKIYEADDPLDSNAFILASNTSSYSNSGYNLLEAVPATGSNYFIGSGCDYSKLGYQKILFGTSEYGCGSTSFSASTCKNILANKTTMNSEDPIPWSFEVTAQTDTAITLKLTAN